MFAIQISYIIEDLLLMPKVEENVTYWDISLIGQGCWPKIFDFKLILHSELDESGRCIACFFLFPNVITNH